MTPRSANGRSTRACRWKPAEIPKYQYRHQWRRGDLVMWDNRSLLHKANGDYDMNQLRYLYRVMLQGDAPV